MVVDTFLGGVAKFLGKTERAPGVLWCSKHQIEHTGTGAYAALLAGYLFNITKDEELLSLAKRVALRVCDQTKVDPAESYIAWIVWPGSRDPHNHANNAIDVGCAVDSLATFARMHTDKMEASAVDRIRDAVTKISDTYILPHARPKEILAQRLWSIAALGSAFEWLQKNEWREAGLECIQKTLQQQNGDGSFPYTPLGTPRSHAGSSDASAFYHSRHALFIVHALLAFGEDPSKEPWGSRLRAACDFLCSLRKADGNKSVFIEAKPWYWGSPYEVAGFPFDISALAMCGRALGESKYLKAAAGMFTTLQKHVLADGGITSHRDAPNHKDWNFQCRFFWNAHVAWIARAREAIEEGLLKTGDHKYPKALAWFPDAGVANYSDDKIVVILRGDGRRRNLNHGSPLSGGGILHFGSRGGDPREGILKNPDDRDISGEWSVVPASGRGLLQRYKKAYRENKDEIRFSAWIARVRARSGDRAGALRWYLERLRLGICVASRKNYSSGFSVDAPGQVVAESLAFRGGVADRFGEPLDGIQTIRRYVFERGLVRVGDALVVERDLRNCSYRLPEAASEASVDGGKANVNKGTVQFGRVAKGSMLAIRYVMKG